MLFSCTHMATVDVKGLISNSCELLLKHQWLSQCHVEWLWKTVLQLILSWLLQNTCSQALYFPVSEVCTCAKAEVVELVEDVEDIWRRGTKFEHYRRLLKAFLFV